MKLGADPKDSSSVGRPFTFRIISPTESLTLQAETEEEMRGWVSDVQGVIAELISRGGFVGGYGAAHARKVGSSSPSGPSGPSGPSQSHNTHHHTTTNTTNTTTDEFHHESHRHGGATVLPLDVVCTAPGNASCADCGAPDPDWASINLLVVLCQRCAGMHRGLGVHVSKVKSLALDRDAWTPATIDLFLAVGNTGANAVWEAYRRPRPAQQHTGRRVSEEEKETPCAASTREDMSVGPLVAAGATPEAHVAAIHAKYVLRSYVVGNNDADARGDLEAAAAALDPHAVLARIAGADVGATKGAEGTAALLAAVAAGDAGAPVAALLLSNGARASLAGDAAETQKAVELALQRGCTEDGPLLPLLRNASTKLF